MNKKLISTIALGVVACAMLVVMTAFALPRTSADAANESVPATNISAAPAAAIPMSNTGSIAGCDFSSLMFDEKGALYSEDVFLANVDKAIEDGVLDAEYKELLLSMYGACAPDSGGGMPCSPQSGGMAGFGGCPFGQ